MVIIILAAVIALIIGFGVSGMWLLRFLAGARGDEIFPWHLQPPSRAWAEVWHRVEVPATSL